MSRADDIAALIEENVAEFLMSMGAAGGGSARSDDEIAWTVGGSPIGYHNAVVRCDADDDRAAELVAAWHDELQTRALPGSWHLTPSMRPVGLADRLVRSGFDDGGEEPAMAVALDDEHIADAPPAGAMTVHLVSTAADLHRYRDVLAAGFGEGPKEADWVVSIYASLGLGPGGAWRHFLGTVDGEPVATASLFLTPRAGGIYFVCTHPDHRRQGYGAAITHHAMAEAAAVGAEFAVLGSSPMGQRVYERLGFRTLFSYRLFEWEPSTSASGQSGRA